MVVAFALIILYREPIRVRWWGFRLARASQPQQRIYYTRLLAERRDAALPVARDLLNRDEAGLRSIGVLLLNVMQSAASAELLARACHDPDADVRRSAIQGLARRQAPRTIDVLTELADHFDHETAMLAVSCLPDLQTPDALQTLGKLAVEHESAAVRVQAIESLRRWNTDAVIDPLIRCLKDDTPFTGPTEMERNASRALKQVAGRVQSVPANAALSLTGGPTVADRAALALRAVTDQSFGFLEAESDEQRQAAIHAWRRWRTSAVESRKTIGRSED